MAEDVPMVLFDHGSLVNTTGIEKISLDFGDFILSSDNPLNGCIRWGWDLSPGEITLNMSSPEFEMFPGDNYIAEVFVRILGRDVSWGKIKLARDPSTGRWNVKS